MNRLNVIRYLPHSAFAFGLLAATALVGCGGGDEVVQTASPTQSAPVAPISSPATQVSTTVQGTTASDVLTQLLGNWSGTCGQSAADSVFSIVYTAVSGSANSVRSQTSHKYYAPGTGCTGAVTKNNTADYLITVDGFDTVSTLPVVRYSYGSFSAGASAASTKATLRLAGTPFSLTEGEGITNAAGYPSALASKATATKQ
jgi:hypothetical protein